MVKGECGDGGHEAEVARRRSRHGDGNGIRRWSRRGRDTETREKNSYNLAESRCGDRRSRCGSQDAETKAAIRRSH